MFTKNKLFRHKGITLVELLIVTGVSVVLITGFIILIDPIQKIGQTNDAKRKTELAQLKRALEIYYQDYGRYPDSTGQYTIKDTNWGEQWPPYMSRLPKDPTSGQNYIYYTPNIGVCANYQCYYIYAKLQRGGYDPQSCFPGTGDACTSAVTYNLENSCGGICNYGISSPNTKP